MPTYDYTCSKCGHAFEVYQSITEDALTVCPKEVCPRKTWGKGKIKRAIGAGAGFIFKGSGFYSTDYRSENYKASAKKDVPTAAPTKSETKTESKSEAKPASNSTAKP